MKKTNEYTGKNIEVNEVDTVFRNDGVAYSVYKDENGKYYIDAYDGAYSIAEFSGDFKTDGEAVKKALDYLNEVGNEGF